VANSYELDVALDSSGVTQGADQAVGALAGLRNQAGLVSTALKGAAGAAVAFAGYQGIQAAIQSAARFEKQMNELKGQVGLSSQEISKIREETMDLAATTGQSTRSIAQGYKFARSAGLDLAEANRAVETATKASAAGFGAQQDLIRTATTAMNTWTDEVESSSSFLNSLTAAAQKMDIQVSGLSSAFRRNVNIASQLNLELDETLAGLGAVAGAAGDASRGGRLFQQVLSGLLAPTEQARENISAVFGSVKNLQESLGNRGLVPTLVTLREELNESGSGLEKVFTSTRRLEGALALTANEGQRAREIMRQMGNTTGVVQETFEETSGTMRQWNKTSQEFNNRLIKWGTNLLPMVNDVLAGVVDSMERFEQGVSGTASAITLLINEISELDELGAQVLGGVDSEDLVRRGKINEVFTEAIGKSGAADRLDEIITRARQASREFEGVNFRLPVNIDPEKSQVDDVKAEVARLITNIDDAEVKKQFKKDVIPLIDAALREGAQDARGVVQFLKFGPGGLREIRKTVNQDLWETMVDELESLPSPIEMAMDDKIRIGGQTFKFGGFEKELSNSTQNATSDGAKKGLRDAAESFKKSLQLPNLVSKQQMDAIKDFRDAGVAIDPFGDVEKQLANARESMKGEFGVGPEGVFRDPFAKSGRTGETPTAGTLDMDAPFQNFKLEGESAAAETATAFEKRLGNSFRAVQSQFTNTLASMVSRGKISFDKLAQSFIQDFMQRSISAMVTEPLFNMILSGGAGGTGGFLGGAFQKGGLLNFGDTPGPISGEMASRSTFAPNDKVIAAKTDQGLQRQVNGATGGSGTVVQNINNEFPTVPNQKIDRRIQKAAPQIAKQAKNMVLDDMERGGGPASTARSA
jgi:TP901 family phage tail tape measure protein